MALSKQELWNQLRAAEYPRVAPAAPAAPAVAVALAPEQHIAKRRGNRGAQIRTGDLSDPNGARYQAAPHPETGHRVAGMAEPLAAARRARLGPDARRAVPARRRLGLRRPRGAGRRHAGGPQALGPAPRVRAGGRRARALGRRRRGAAAARDDERHALLLERCEPGTFLSQRRRRSARRPDRAAAAALEGRDRLPHARGRGRVVGRAASGEVGDAGSRAELAATQGELVLVHQDLHGDNVLAAAARAVARHRPEAARRRARVRGRADRPLARARPLEARRARPSRPALRRARPRPRARPRLDDRADDRLVGRQRPMREHMEVVEWLS